MLETNNYCYTLHRDPFAQETPSTALRKLLADIVVYRWADKDWKRSKGAIREYPVLDIASVLDRVKVTGRASTAPWMKSRLHVPWACGGRHAVIQDAILSIWVVTEVVSAALGHGRVVWYYWRERRAQQH